MPAPAGSLTFGLATDPPYSLLRSGRTVANDSDTVTDAYADRFVRVGANEPGTNGERPPTQVRWPQGFYLMPESCFGSRIIDLCASQWYSNEQDNPVSIGPVQPPMVETSVDCSTFGSSGPQMAERVRRKLRANRSAQLEFEFWTGIEAQSAGYVENQWLTKTSAEGTSNLTIIENGAAVGTTTALAELEQAIAQGSSWDTGYIHCMPRTATHWFENGLIHETRPGVYVTGLGSVVVVGRGYPGWGPGVNNFAFLDTGNDAGVWEAGQYAWAYATTTVYVGTGRVLDTEMAEDSHRSSLDPETNARAHRAWQPVFAAWDGCVHAGVMIDHNATRTAIGS